MVLLVLLLVLVRFLSHDVLALGLVILAISKNLNDVLERQVTLLLLLVDAHAELVVLDLEDLSFDLDLKRNLVAKLFALSSVEHEISLVDLLTGLG